MALQTLVCQTFVFVHWRVVYVVSLLALVKDEQVLHPLLELQEHLLLDVGLDGCSRAGFCPDSAWKYW